MQLREALGRAKSEWRDYVLITFGCVLCSVALNMFLVPNKIAPGGVSGVATVLFHQFGFPVGVVILVLNVPLFLLGFFVLGRSFGVKTFYATILLSVLVDTMTWLPVLTDDGLLGAVFGGMSLGAGLGLVFYANATTGGTDLLAMLIHRAIPLLSVGRILLIIDFLVVSYATLSFGNYEFGLFAIITLYLAARLIDEIVAGADRAKGVYIISLKTKEISNKLVSRNRGVTVFYGRGAWTGKDRELLLCIIRNREIPQVKKVIRDVDPGAFVFVTQVSEVLGEGFKPH